MRWRLALMAGLGLAIVLAGGCGTAGWDQYFNKTLLDPSATADGPASAAPQASHDFVSDLAPDMAGGSRAFSPTADDSVEMPGVAASDVQAADMAQQRVMIYSAGYQLAVADPAVKVGEARSLAAEADGYVQHMTDDTITLRVPADRFEQVSARVERMGQLLRREIEAQDVTDQYVDVTLRLKTAQAMLDRLQALMAKATDTKSALEIEREIARVTTEIETLKGRLRLLERRIAFSSIAITFTRLAEAPPATLAKRRLPFAWLKTLSLETLLDY